jgi:hypothetical protein
LQGHILSTAGDDALRTYHKKTGDLGKKLFKIWRILDMFSMKNASFSPNFCLITYVFQVDIICFMSKFGENSPGKETLLMAPMSWSVNFECWLVID